MESTRRTLAYSLIATTLLVTQLGGCGLEGDDRSPGVSSQTPAANSVDVATDSSVVLAFNESLLTNSLTTGSLTLSTNDISIAGDLGYDAASLSLEFVPSALLPLGTTFEANYGPGITDLAGNPVASGSWSFTTVDGAWQTAAALSTTLSNASNPSVEVDNNGYGIATWLESDGINQAVHAAHYVPGSGWNPPGIIDIFPLGDGSLPVLDLNKVTGQAIVAWLEDNAGTTEVWTTIYDPSIGWGTPVRANDGSANSATGAPSVYISESGIASVAWVEIDAALTEVWANQFDPIAGWGTPVLVQTDATQNGTSPIVKGNSQDQVVLVWQQSNAGSQFNVYFSTIAAGGTWAAPVELDNTSDFALRGDIAINETGNVLVVWAQGTAIALDIYSRWYTPATGWGAPGLAGTGAGELSGQTQLVLTDDDEAKLLYLVGNTGTTYQLYIAEFTGDAGWSAATVFAAVAGNDLLLPRLEINQFGVMQAAWIEAQGSLATATESHVKQRRFRPDIGWGSAITLYSATNEIALAPRIALANSGESLLIWQHTDISTATNILQRVFAE